MYEISVISLPLPRYSDEQSEGPIIKPPRVVVTEAEALTECSRLVQAGYWVEVNGPDGDWDNDEVRRRLALR